MSNIDPEQRDKILVDYDRLLAQGKKHAAARNEVIKQWKFVNGLNENKIYKLIQDQWRRRNEQPKVETEEAETIEAEVKAETVEGVPPTPVGPTEAEMATTTKATETMTMEVTVEEAPNPGPEEKLLIEPTAPNTARARFFEPSDQKQASAPFFESQIKEASELAVKRAVITSPTAQDLVRRVNESFDEVDEAGRKLVTVARNSGILLHRWKDTVGHGNWIAAYESSGFNKNIDTARTWMELAALSDAEIADIPSIRQALTKLKEKKQGTKRKESSPLTMGSELTSHSTW